MLSVLCMDECSTHAFAHFSAKGRAKCALVRHQPGHHSFLHHLWGRRWLLFSWKSHSLWAAITFTFPEDSEGNNLKSHSHLQKEKKRKKKQLIHSCHKMTLITPRPVPRRPLGEPSTMRNKATHCRAAVAISSPYVSQDTLLI